MRLLADHDDALVEPLVPKGGHSRARGEVAAHHDERLLRCHHVLRLLRAARNPSESSSPRPSLRIGTGMPAIRPLAGGVTVSQTIPLADPLTNQASKRRFEWTPIPNQPARPGSAPTIEARGTSARNAHPIRTASSSSSSSTQELLGPRPRTMKKPRSQRAYRMSKRRGGAPTSRR